MTTETTCELCGVQTTMLGTKRCDRCWELEKRIKADPDIALKVLSDMPDLSCCGCGAPTSRRVTET